MAQNYGIFCQLRSKLAITQTIAIKWKEKNDAKDCHQSLCLCGDRMKMSLPKKMKTIFLGRLPLLPGSHLGEISAPRLTILP